MMLNRQYSRLSAFASFLNVGDRWPPTQLPLSLHNQALGDGGSREIGIAV